MSKVWYRQKDGKGKGEGDGDVEGVGAGVGVGKGEVCVLIMLMLVHLGSEQRKGTCGSDKATAVRAAAAE